VTRRRGKSVKTELTGEGGGRKAWQKPLSPWGARHTVNRLQVASLKGEHKKSGREKQANQFFFPRVQGRFAWNLGDLRSPGNNQKIASEEGKGQFGRLGRKMHRVSSFKDCGERYKRGTDFSKTGVERQGLVPREGTFSVALHSHGEVGGKGSKYSKRAL